MSAAIHHPILFWRVHPIEGRAGAGLTHGPDGAPIPPPAPDPAQKPASVWRSQSFASEHSTPRRRRATRYERFTTRMVLLSTVLTLVVTMGLHIGNYGLETRTSSTSGTHSNFYK
ncbi:hypothetical protein [Leucobacter luti]|uniref:Uncharacterized protein n=1 Tax=Leucobacter luti TaxID=340320 RepID=A0A4Q7TNF9_9MICO|nr:hypothetical protein [Leucobacter luti]MBL3700199.1 hypothetical protein [Leucobacter luti]RZT61078.1 hypothetical protein EV139_2826 [Leucobacter luti]